MKLCAQEKRRALRTALKAEYIRKKFDPKVKLSEAVVLYRKINNEIEAKMLTAGLVSVDRSRLCGTATSFMNRSGPLCTLQISVDF